MIGLSLPVPDAGPLKVLCLGAHSDDIEIGCGGTILFLRTVLPRIQLHWVVLSAEGKRCWEAQKAAGLFTTGCDATVLLKDYRDGFFPYHGAEIKKFFEEMKGQINPDLIFTHWRGDAHQDHRLVSELTWNTFRNHMILEYEIPKYDGDMGRPNLFVPLDDFLCERKIEYLFDAFKSQTAKPWFDRRMFAGLMRVRGMESNCSSGFAEAFHVSKCLLRPSL